MVAKQKMSAGSSQQQKGSPKVRFRSESRERFTLERDGASTARHRPVITLSEEFVLHPDNDPYKYLPDDEAWRCEMNRRAQREALIKHKLQQGYSVMFRSTGASLSPQILPGDCCLFHPVWDAHNCINKNDVVYSNVNCKGRQKIFAHMVLNSYYEMWWDVEKQFYRRKRKFVIGNAKGVVNGTAWDHEIFGRLVEVIE